MKYSLFFSLLVLFNAYFLVQCGFSWKVSDTLPEPENTSLVLGVNDQMNYCIIAHFALELEAIKQNSGSYTKYLFLCPAASEEEREINLKRSKTQNTLFIRETYKVGDSKLDEIPTEEKQFSEHDTNKVGDSKLDENPMEEKQSSEHDTDKVENSKSDEISTKDMQISEHNTNEVGDSKLDENAMEENQSSEQDTDEVENSKSDEISTKEMQISEHDTNKVGDSKLDENPMEERQSSEDDTYEVGDSKLNEIPTKKRQYTEHDTNKVGDSKLDENPMKERQSSEDDTYEVENSKFDEISTEERQISEHDINKVGDLKVDENPMKERQSSEDDTYKVENSKSDEILTKEMQFSEDGSKSDSEVSETNYFEFLNYDCQKPVEPSVEYIAFDDTYYGTELYFIGFEVFMDDKHKELRTLGYPKFVKIDRVDFRWFNVLSIRFDRENGNVLCVAVEVLDISPSTSPRYQMKDYSLDPKINNLGNTIFYGEVDIKYLYSLDNQENIFKKLFEDSSLRNTYFNREEKYLVETHLAALNVFETPLLEKAAHTYANIAAMWKIIKENSWAKVETKIKSVVHELRAIFVITGTYETLKLENKEIYLGSEENIRVPLVFFKMVQYVTEGNLYSMLIVTINNPYTDVADETINLCPKNQCEEYGWEYVEQGDHRTGRTLCCEVTLDNMTRLQLDRSVKIDRVLNLKEISILKSLLKIEKPSLNYEERKLAMKDEDVPSSNSQQFNIANFLGSFVSNFFSFVQGRSQSDFVAVAA